MIHRTPKQAEDNAITLRARVAQLEEALREVIGDHNAPDDCFSTGPLTGDPLRDARCPACAALRILTGPTAEWLEDVKREAAAEELRRMAGHVYREYSIQAGNFLASRAAELKGVRG